MPVTGKEAMEPAEVNRSNDVPKLSHFFVVGGIPAED
jgi:hypothetical protein